MHASLMYRRTEVPDTRGNEMQDWIVRASAALCAGGSIALYWTFGFFLAVPWREGRLLSLNGVEWQVLLVPLLAGTAVAWGTLHLLAMVDRARPRVFGVCRAAVLLFSLAAVYCGMLSAPSASSHGVFTSAPR